MIGERLHGHIRESDTAARIGGDEFALILEDISDRQAVEKTIGEGDVVQFIPSQLEISLK